MHSGAQSKSLGLQNLKNAAAAKYATILSTVLNILSMTLPAPLEPIDWALIRACDNADLNKVACLLPMCDLRKSNFAAFRGAVRKGYVEIVQLFLSTTTELPKHAALQDAVLLGHTAVVPLLVGAHDSNSYALISAATFGAKRREIIKQLLPFCDYQLALQRIEHNNTHNMGNTDPTVLEQCIQEYESEQQRGRLLNEIEPQTQRIGARKM